MFFKKIKGQQSRKRHGDSSDGENTKKFLHKPLFPLFLMLPLFYVQPQLAKYRLCFTLRWKVWKVLWMGAVVSEAVVWKGHNEEPWFD